MHSSEKNKAKTRLVMLDASAHEVYHVIEKFRFHKFLPHTFTLFVDVSDLRHNRYFSKEKSN